MDTLSITLDNKRLVDGFIRAANGAGLPAADLALEFLEAQARRYADDFKIGVLTSAAFVARFAPAEYAAIIAAAETNEAVAALIGELTASPQVALDDPRLAPGLSLLVAEELIAPERVAELLAYERPTPEVV